MSNRIAVIGTGYVGLVSGTCFAESGHKVLCVDIDAQKVEKLRHAEMPIYEPGLEHLLARNIKEERLTFTTELEEAVINCNVLFLCLPTPPGGDGAADLNFVLKAAGEIGRLMVKNNIDEPRIIVNKSTVPVGTAAKVGKVLKEAAPDKDTIVVSNPEFLREGFAVEDFMKPERVIIGTENDYARDIMRDLYEPFVRSGNPIYFMDEKSAEVSKYAANSFLAMKITFMNDLAAYCEEVGADIENVRTSIGSDSRIGKRFLFAGIGYGGSCFPKDVKALIHSADSCGTPLKIMNAVEEVNKFQTERFFKRIEKRFTSLKGKHLAVWGLAFKPNTDDVREAPAYKIIDKLLEAGASVAAYDPEAVENTRKIYGDRIAFLKRDEVLKDADALVICTEWTEFRKPDFDVMKSDMKQHIIFDGRNLYDLASMAETGFEYYSIGRASITND
ncbi:MAG TPA: UDP-glucose/GDP-mannose dehydrogenase family protein [Patescibacteria group bacterium]|nr:UDP-glucose/GDP-mannose dehydrogenase family protein [Patescibacteria group bacterium]